MLTNYQATFDRVKVNDVTNVLETKTLNLPDMYFREAADWASDYVEELNGKLRLARLEQAEDMGIAFEKLGPMTEAWVPVKLQVIS